MSRPKIDYVFLFSVIALAAVGVIMIFSASPTLALKHGDPFYYIKRHLFYLLLGMGALYYGFHLKLENLKKNAYLILLVSIGLLIMVFVPGVGRKVLGASRWIDLGILSFQPSEVIKFALLLFLARWLSEKKAVIKDFRRGILPPLALLLLIGVLIIKQPDLGTFIVTSATFFALFFIAGMESWQLAFMGLAGLIGVLILSLSSPYRFRRIVAYLDPWKDPQGVGFHIIQSLLAIGSGGLLGLGLGASRQKFYYLPQQFTDFIFAILCEELGFIGGLGVIILFVAFCARGFKIMLEAKDSFNQYLVGGIISWLTLQAAINIMVVLGLIPTTGIPLPFISYGGTATIINLFVIGIVLNVSRKG
jgi:cell division protein FtsW